jgi:type I restriction enzyme R subunit
MSEKLTVLAQNSGLEYEALKAFVDNTTDRLIFDATKLTDLFAPLELGWKERVKREVNHRYPEKASASRFIALLL